MKCGEKWGKNHKCPTQIPLHILEEILEAVNPPEDYEEDKETGSSDEELFTLSFVAVEGIQGKITMMLQGMVKNKELLLLIDLGSSRPFISQKDVQALQYSVQEVPLVRITIANGGKLASTGIIAEGTWYTQGHTFTTSARILVLQHYDMIFGID